MSKKVRKIVSTVSRVVTPIIAIATGQPWLAALSLASNIKGPVGQIAGLASAFSGISGMLGGPTIDGLAGSAFGYDATKVASQIKGSLASNLGVTPTTLTNVAQTASKVNSLVGAGNMLVGALKGQKPQGADLAALGASGNLGGQEASGAQRPSLEQSGGRGQSGVGDAFRASETAAPEGSSFGSVARRLGGFRDTSTNAYT